MTRHPPKTVRERYDLVCPECGSDDHLYFEATTWFTPTPQGLVEAESVDRTWQEWSRCECAACAYDGHIEDFRPKEVSS